MGLEDLQLLVLDEADRLLEMGFSEEVHTCFHFRHFGTPCPVYLRDSTSKSAYEKSNQKLSNRPTAAEHLHHKEEDSLQASHLSKCKNGYWLFCQIEKTCVQQLLRRIQLNPFLWRTNEQASKLFVSAHCMIGLSLAADPGDSEVGSPQAADDALQCDHD